nr:DUF6508 domain-containing protein [uncultured Anaerotignum sp.]
MLANQDVLNEALVDDCQGLEFSFDRVKLPAGGGTAFEIPSADGDDSEMAKDITGVIVYNHPAWGMDSMSTAVVENLDAKCVLAMILGAVRAERFCDGALLGFFENGSIARWIERLKALDTDGENVVAK